MRNLCEPHHGTAADDPPIAAVAEYRCFVFQMFQEGSLACMRRPDYEASADSDAFRVNPIDKRQTSRPAIILFDDRNADGRPIPDPQKRPTLPDRSCPI